MQKRKVMQKHVRDLTSLQLLRGRRWRITNDDIRLDWLRNTRWGVKEKSLIAMHLIDHLPTDEHDYVPACFPSCKSWKNQLKVKVARLFQKFHGANWKNELQKLLALAEIIDPDEGFVMFGTP